MSVRCALLLRAVNVSGRNRVPMAELRALLGERTRLSGVSTYIASGNVIADVPGALDAACAEVRMLIREAFDVDTPVIARTHEQLAAALTDHPFGDAAEEKMLHIMFLESTPIDGAVQALTPRLLPGERIALDGHDLWIDYGRSGAGATKLTRPVLDRALGVAGTARNLLTLRRLVQLTAPTGSAAT
ncbi:DUF1697 domain-containing protein [Microbacterium sp. ARD32]|uniref:DUF1697 domain-containing protein n=1 Tax=Microbacterium sp. ARD32 TaxID=2962577 RepID=UPI0028811332|nr:DUF1697 domain-containing protein [Microbacterium sp. ARD32]MDT0158483.1 DUF1697 domain-containing protein [Microbacterium sp. ARD32]